MPSGLTTSEFQRDDLSMISESLMNKDLKPPKIGQAYPKRPSVRFEQLDEDNQIGSSYGIYINKASPYNIPSQKVRSSTFRQTDKTILEQAELDEVQEASGKELEEGDKNAKSEYGTYDKYLARIGDMVKGNE